jgi:hypothetical protein
MTIESGSLENDDFGTLISWCNYAIVTGSLKVRVMHSSRAVEGNRPDETAATPEALGRCQIRQSLTLEDEGSWYQGHLRLFCSREVFFVVED